jgi:hypothetical protein
MTNCPSVIIEPFLISKIQKDKDKADLSIKVEKS